MHIEKKSKEEWRAVVAAFRKSGLSRVEFARNQNLKVDTLRYHLAKSAPKKKSREFVPVEMQSEETIAIELPSGAKVFIPLSVDGEWLKTILCEL